MEVVTGHLSFFIPIEPVILFTVTKCPAKRLYFLSHIIASCDLVTTPNILTDYLGVQKQNIKTIS